MKYLAIFVLGAALAASAFGQSEGWKDQHGKPVPETEARRSLNGFGGWLLVTPDLDWREKWDTPPDTAPHFREAKSVRRGQQVFVLAFFANPKLTRDGSARILCDLGVTRPDGTTSTKETDVVCFEGALKNPSNMFLSSVNLGFIGEPSDPAGVWTVRVTFKDTVRKTVLPLKTTFVLE